MNKKEKQTDIKISVIVPMHNVEQFIRTCVDSILAQTMQDFEVLLLDDASTDSTIDICRQAYGREPRVRIVPSVCGNLGVAAIRNMGMGLAGGTYLAFVDGDDWLEPRYLECLYRAAEQEQAEVVMGNHCHQIPGEQMVTVAYAKAQERLPAEPRARLELFLQRRISPMVWGKLYARDFLLRSHIRFQDIMSEDELFNLPVCCYAGKIVSIPEANYHYRISRDSLTQGNSEQHIRRVVQSGFQVLGCLEQYIRQIPLLREPDLRERLYQSFLGIMLNWHLKNVYQRTAPRVVSTIVHSEVEKCVKDPELAIYIQFLLNNHIYEQMQKENRG